MQKKRQESEEEGTEPARQRIEVTAGGLQSHRALASFLHELWAHSCMLVVGQDGTLSRCSVMKGLKWHAE